MLLSNIRVTICDLGTLLFLALVLFCNSLTGQSVQPSSAANPPVIGAPLIRNYLPSEYGAQNQNWAIVQDTRGVMYIGNGHGILEYDGVSWNMITTERGTVVRSMARDANGRIYVASFGEIGYLSPDSTQQLRFVSLAPYLDEQYRNFSDVWQTLATPEGIYFVTQKYIFRWNGEKMHVWTAETTFHVGFAVNGQFLVRQSMVGLMEIKSDSLMMVPFGEQFAQDRIMSILPYASAGKDQYLIGTRDNGLFLYDRSSITSFSTDADALLKAGLIYCGARLQNGQYAFGTLQDGVFVFDEAGTLRLHLNKAAGLQDETIWYLYTDRQGGVWIGMHVGISRAETGSPHTHFGEREGLEGSVLEILRHNGRLYAATTMGIYVLDERPGAHATSGKFQRIPGVSPQAWALQSFGTSLLAGTFDGVYEIRDDNGKSINATYCMSLLRSRIDTNRVFVGLQKGMKSLYYMNGRWIDEGRIEGMDYEIISIYETPEGKLWLSARYNGLELVDYSNGFSTKPPRLHFDTLQGLTSLEKTTPFLSAQGIRFASAHGVFRFDEQQQRFYQDTTLFKGIPSQLINLFSVGEDRYGNLWVITPGQSGVAILQPDKTYEWQSSPFFRIAGIDDYYAYPDPLNDSITWLGCVDRVIRFDARIQQGALHTLETLIRQVVINGDSLLYGGAGTVLPDMITLTHGFKSLRIRYAAPSFDDESNTLYQYMLEGSDADWSNWSKETYKDYTGMAQGRYRFLVRSKNIYQKIGETAVLEFEILPPFYLTWWAILIYSLLVIAALVFLRQGEMTRLQKKHLVQFKQLEFEKLKELDQLKSRFFANISHEFRTPLTLILGPTDHLLATHPDEERAKQYHMIKRNAQRLLGLINQLLDLSKLEAGRMKLELSKEDIVPLIKAITHAFESLTVSKNMELRLNTQMDHAIVNFDRDKMEQILINLISNAVKFTPDGGIVSVTLKKDTRAGQLQIEVADNGPGIAKDQLSYVFDRFYQGTEATHTGEPGSGIGLALAKELVELHQGRISVSSVEHQGTSFTITLPYIIDGPAVSGSVPTTTFNQAAVPPDLSGEAMGSFTDDEAAANENTLLLVEDNPDMRAFIRDTLVGHYRILEASDGQEGVDKAFESIPDIIISDVMMPRMDGLQLCEILKQDERTSHIPVILLTAKASIDSRLAGLKRGADDYLAKPFHREELLIRSRNLLDMRQRLRARYASLQPPAPAEEESVRIEDVFLLKVTGIVDEHLSESEFEIDELSHLVGMSRSQMFRKIKALTGQSPSLFIRNIRLQRGKTLLETTGMNVNEVAYQVGFSAPSYFSDAFTQTFGFRPSQLKK